MKDLWDGYVRDYQDENVITTANNVVAANEFEAVRAAAAAVLERGGCWPEPVQKGLAKAAGGKYQKRGDVWGVIQNYSIAAYYPVIQVHLKN